MIWVKDASRGVGVASNLLSTDLRADFVAKVQAEYDEVRARTCRQAGRNVRMLSLAEARANKAKIDWIGVHPAGARQARPQHVFDNYPLEEIARYIDWTPFFITWELHGRFPAILRTKRSASKPPSCSTTRRRC